MVTSPLSNKKFLFIYPFVWIVWMLMQTVVLNWLGFSLKIAFTDSIVSILLLAATGLAVSNNLKYYQPSENKYWMLFVWGIGISVLWIYIIQWSLKHLLPNELEYLVFLKKSLPVRFCIALLMAELMAVLSFVWYNLEEQKINESRKSDAKKLTKEAELFKLRQQLQPHFLFNSLNSISALAGSKPEEARKMIQQLSDFLRVTLKQEEQQLVTLKEELEHLQLYLNIEKIRFGHRLETDLQITEASNSMVIPQLLLQPIVENAIKFGLYDTTDKVVIVIQASLNQNELEVSIKNPFDASTTRPKQGIGFGLTSVNRRLYLLFARNNLLETYSKGNVFITKVKIPQQHA